jgi:hypothetical protein
MFLREKAMKNETPELTEQQLARERLKAENSQREVEAMMLELASISPWKAAVQRVTEYQAKKQALPLPGSGRPTFPDIPVLSIKDFISRVLAVSGEPSRVPPDSLPRGTSRIQLLFTITGTIHAVAEFLVEAHFACVEDTLRCQIWESTIYTEVITLSVVSWTAELHQIYYGDNGTNLVQKVQIRSMP